MFDLLPLAGGLLSQKRKQINELNSILKKMNRCEVYNPERLQHYLDKLIAFHKKTFVKKDPEQPIRTWFSDHPLFRTQRQVEQIINKHRLRLDVVNLFQKINLVSLYREYEGKDSFKTLIKARITAINPHYKVASLGGGNNPLVRISLAEEQHCVVRFLRLNSSEDAAGISPRIARERIAGMKQIPQPYFLSQLEDDRQEVTYLECSEYYEHGSLERLFDELHQQENDERAIDLNPLILLYARQFLEFFIELNQHDVWYTDLKPSNVLLNQDGDIIISDVKGLVISSTKMVRSSQTSTSAAYYQSSVYKDSEINLERLQRQTLANTLYELACDKLPVPKITHHPNWRNKYDFEQACFQSEEGQFIKAMILELNKRRSKPLSNFLNSLDTFTKAKEQQSQALHEEGHPHVGLDDSRSSFTF